MIRQSTTKSTNQNRTVFHLHTNILQRKTLSRSDFGNSAIEIGRPALRQFDRFVLPSEKTHFKHDFSKIPVISNFFYPVQAKLKVGKPDDKYEKEADLMADQVMRMPEPRCPCSCVHGRGQAYQNDSEQLRMKHDKSSDSSQTAVPHTVREILQSDGKPLAKSTQTFMEPHFGHDFSKVRIHSNSKAATLATALKAKAFTVGNHIVLNRGIPSFSTSSGRHILAHELTHVVQQSHSKPAIARLSASDCSSDCAKEDGQGTATGKFSITVYADKEGAFLLLPGTHKVGHSWLRLEDDQGRYWTYGFWPQEGYGNIGKWGDKGCVHHPDTSHTPTASQQFELTAAQFTSALNSAQKYCLDKPNYDLFGLQCTEFVKRVLAAAGQGSFGGFGLIWESPNALNTWIRTHSLILGTSVTADTSAQGGAGVWSFGANLAYRHQFYSLLGEKLRLYGFGRAELSAPVKSITAGAGLELNPQKVWLPVPFLEGGSVLGDLAPLPGQSRFGAGVTGSAGLRFNIDEIGLVGVEYNVVKDIVNRDPVLHRLMLTAGIKIF